MSDEVDQTLTEAIAGEVRAAMGRRRKSQRDLAEFLGVNVAAANRRYHGTQAYPVAELARIAAWLDVPVSDLIRPADRATRVAS